MSHIINISTINTILSIRFNFGNFFIYYYFVFKFKSKNTHKIYEFELL